MPPGTEDPGTAPATVDDPAASPPSGTPPEATTPPEQQPQDLRAAGADFDLRSSPDATFPTERTAPAPPAEEPKEGAPAGQPAAPDWEALLEKADPDALRKNRRLMGIAGEMAQRLATAKAEELAQARAVEIADERVRQREAEAREAARLEKVDAGDYYALGQEHAAELLKQKQERDAKGAEARVAQSFEQRTQATLEEWAQAFPPEVLTKASEAYAARPRAGDFNGDLKTYLEVFVPVLSDHLQSQKAAETEAALFAKWEKERLPALRARALAELNGGEPVPDTAGGAAPRTRTFTDDDVRRMSLEDYKKYFDVETAKPREGVIYRPTRSVDPRQIATTGRGM